MKHRQFLLGAVLGLLASCSATSSKDELGARESQTLVRARDQTYELEQNNVDSACLKGVCVAELGAPGGEASRMLLQVRKEDIDRGERDEIMVAMEEDNEGDEQEENDVDEEGKRGKNKQKVTAASTSGGNNEKLWKPFSGKGKVCEKGRAFRKGKTKVKSQMDCQEIAVSKGHPFYQYKAGKKGKAGQCYSVKTCPKQKRKWGNWKIFAANMDAAKSAKSKADAEAAAKKEQIKKLTASWPSTEWPQCGYDKHMCTNKRPVPVLSMMECQKKARDRMHPYFQYQPYPFGRIKGMCATVAMCDRPVPWPHKWNGRPSNWKIYTWRECIEWTTRTTTTTTTVTQAQTPVDKTMGASKAVGGCNDPGTKPDGARDAWRAGSALGYGLEVRVFKVPGAPHIPKLHSKHWPGTYQMNYGGGAKQFYPVGRSDGKEGVVWIGRGKREKVYVTWFAKDLKTSESVLLYSSGPSESLQAAASNNQDGIVLITAKDAPKRNRHQQGKVFAMRFDASSGARVKKRELPNFHSDSQKFWRQFSFAAGSAAWDNKSNDIALYLSFLATMMSDGKNHESGHTFIINGSTLEVKQRLWGASHSFGNSIIQAEERNEVGARDFIKMDMGDAGPRGVQVTRLDRLLSAFTFSSDGAYYYRQRNNLVFPVKKNQRYYNNIFSELGHPGVVQVKDGILAFFLGENSSITRHTYNTPRDVGFVKLSSDARTIMSPNQGRTKGLNYITNYRPTKESASRLKTYRLSPERILISYEVWTPKKYSRTVLMELDKDGNVVRGKWDMCEKMQLPPQDDTFVRNGKGIAYAGSDQGLIRYEICAGDKCV